MATEYSKNGYSKILVKAPNYIGDNIMFFPALYAISKIFPRNKCQVDLLISNKYKDLYYKKEAYFNQFHFTDWDSHQVKPWTVAAFIKQYRYEAVISFTRQFRFLCGFWLGKIPHRIAYKKYPYGFLANKGKNETIDDGAAKIGQIQYYMYLLEKILGENINDFLKINQKAIDDFCTINIDDKWENDASRIMQSHLISTMDIYGILNQQPYYIIAPGSAETYYGNLKRWPLWNFVEVAKHLQKSENLEIKNLLPVFIFGPQENSLYNEFQNKVFVSQKLRPSVVLPPGATTLGQALSIYNHSRFILSNDSGPRHIAHGLKKKVVTIFGPTSLTRANYSIGLEFPIWVNVGCNLLNCKQNRCPEGNICLTSITPLMVKNKIMEFIFNRKVEEIC